MKRKNSRARAFAPDPDAPPHRFCDKNGCTEQAGYRAPRSRETLNDYYWFCLEHIREYNARWDFYKGMSPGQIEAHLRADVSWDRPSWKLGHIGRQPFNEEDVLDPLDIMGAAGRPRRGRGKGAPPSSTRNSVPDTLRQPLDTMGLEWPVSIEEVRIRYRHLAKLHHPDANNGSPESEERLKLINIAYTTLRAHFESHVSSGLEKTA